MGTSLQTPNLVTSKPAVPNFSHRDDQCGYNSAAMTGSTSSKTSADSVNSSMALVPQEMVVIENEHTTLGKNTHSKTLISAHGSDTVVTSDEKNPGEIAYVVAVSILIKYC